MWLLNDVCIKCGPLNIHYGVVCCRLRETFESKSEYLIISPKQQGP